MIPNLSDIAAGLCFGALCYLVVVAIYSFGG